MDVHRHFQFDAARHRDFGDGVDAPLLAGIAGHNLCLDISPVRRTRRRAPACPVHGEASNVDYDLRGGGAALTASARLPLAGLDVERQLELRGRAVWIRETVRNTGRRRQADRLDAARHARAAVSRRRDGPNSARP